ncbi:lipocalin-like domain-containing protein [Marivita sp. XM-24bin2]|uniref:lipocalin-like domain-containing protein n=2 Tax=unclassified Marivita TaxID=2632480 RepID=UPI0025BD3023|nr:lipocalin-like domain-containing protein [Marivita sp. XM-24bin2]
MGLVVPAAAAAGMIDALLDEAAEAQFEPLTGNWVLSLPADHGAHPSARAETWSLAAHLETPGGEEYDVSWSLARFGIVPPEERNGRSPWDLVELHAGQFLLFDAEGGAVHSAVRFSRLAGTAGHDPEKREVWLDEWSLLYGAAGMGEGLSVRASGPEALVHLNLVPEKTALRGNEDSQAATRGFTMPRLSVAGTLQTPHATVEVTGTAWLDRLWGDVPPPGGPIAYDRLTLHLSDGTDISVVQTRRAGRDGLGTFDSIVVGPDGQASYLGDEALEVEILEWRQGQTGSKYPVSWRLQGKDFDLSVIAAAQGVRQDFLTPVWQAPVSVNGQRDGKSVEGTGMLLLSGYEQRKP